MNFPDQSLGYILADAGYDVWLGNMRGNRYSRAHVKYNPDHDEQFWDFSYDEMAHDDLPSMILYILNVTKHTQIGYVGHSQGTIIGFAEFGRVDSVVQNNVSFWAALAPVAHLGHMISPLKYLSSPTIVEDIRTFIGIYYLAEMNFFHRLLYHKMAWNICMWRSCILDRATLSEYFIYFMWTRNKKYE